MSAKANDLPSTLRDSVTAFSMLLTLESPIASPSERRILPD